MECQVIWRPIASASTITMFYTGCASCHTPTSLLWIMTACDYTDRYTQPVAWFNCYKFLNWWFQQNCNCQMQTTVTMLWCTASKFQLTAENTGIKWIIIIIITIIWQLHILKLKLVAQQDNSNFAATGAISTSKYSLTNRHQSPNSCHQS